MVHRVLVAVEWNAGRYDCYRSQQYAQVVSEPIVDAVTEAAAVQTGVTAAGVLETLDPLVDEALVVRSAGRTWTYRVHRLGVPTASGPGTDAALLVPAADPGGYACLACALRTAKGVLGDAVDAGLIPHPLAEGYLATMAARHPDVPADALWVPVETDDSS